MRGEGASGRRSPRTTRAEAIQPVLPPGSLGTALFAAGRADRVSGWGPPHAVYLPCLSHQCVSG
eukprot:663990-Prymnesium_polylepis.1